MQSKNIFTKRKTILKDIKNEVLQDICEKLVYFNPGVIAGYSNKFILDENNNIEKELQGKSVIYLYCPVKKIIIPEDYRILGDYISPWYKDEAIAKIVNMDFNFEDGKKIEDYFLYMDKDKMEKEKKYIYPKKSNF